MTWCVKKPWDLSIGVSLLFLIKCWVLYLYPCECIVNVSRWIEGWPDNAGNRHSFVKADWVHMFSEGCCSRDDGKTINWHHLTWNWQVSFWKGIEGLLFCKCSVLHVQFPHHQRWVSFTVDYNLLVILMSHRRVWIGLHNSSQCQWLNCWSDLFPRRVWNLGSGFSQCCRLQYFKVSMIFLCLGSVLARLLLPGLSQMWRRYLRSFLYSHRHARDDADRQQISLHPQVGSVDLNLLGVCPTACLLPCSFWVYWVYQ